MNRAPAAPWRRLAPLAVLVLALHLLLLQGGPERLTTQREAGPRFVTRTVEPAAPAPAPEVAPAPVAVAPVAVAPPAPAPAPPRPREPAPPVAAPSPTPTPATQATPAPGADGSTAFVPQALGIPEPARLHYELTVQARGRTLTGQAHLDWRHDGQDYQARLELAAPGYPGRVQRSVGRLTDAGLAPGYFSDKYRGEQATHFDREQGRVVFSSNRPPAALVEGMQDRLSVIVQLSVLVAGEPARFVPGTELAIPTAGTREADAWTFSVEGEEDLLLPGGAVRALKLQRLPRREYDQKLELWLAPGQDYAPVRLRLTNPDGGVVDQRWASTDRG